MRVVCRLETKDYNRNDMNIKLILVSNKENKLMPQYYLPMSLSAHAERMLQSTYHATNVCCIVSGTQPHIARF